MGRGTSKAGKGGNPNFTQKTFQNKVQAFQDAGKDKTKVAATLSDLKTFLNDNIQISESGGISTNDMGVKHIFNVSGNRAWYINKSGTLFILAPNGDWLKFNKSGGVTNEGKISAKDKLRVKSLANKMHS